MEKFESLKKEIEKYKLLILDFDGTIVSLYVNWVGLKKELTEYCYVNKKIEIDFNQIDLGLAKAKSKFGKSFYLELLKIVESYEKDDKNYVPNEVLINYLNTNELKYAIYSMNTHGCIKSFIKKNIKNKPLIILSRESVLEPKPSGKNIDLILKKFNIHNTDAIYIGNSVMDRDSGKEAKVKTIII